MSRKIPNASEMGRTGGKRLVEKYGKDHMAKISKIGRKNVQKRDPEYFDRLAKAGLHAREVKIQTRIAKELGEHSAVEKFAKLLLGG